MKYIKFENKNLSSICYGLAQTMKVNQSEFDSILDYVMDNGINVIDSADSYYQGLSDERLGIYLNKNKRIRENLWIQNKCGLRQGSIRYYDLSAKQIQISVENTLKRLHTDRLDLLFFHRPDVLINEEEVAQKCNALIKSGKILNVGVCNCSPSFIERLKAFGIDIKFCQMQLSCAYTNLVDDTIRFNSTNSVSQNGLLDYLKLNKIILQVWRVLGFGNFEGFFIDNPRFALLNDTLSSIANKYDVSPETIAVTWVLQCNNRGQALCGSTKKERILRFCQSTDISLTKEEWYRIYDSTRIVGQTKLP